MTLILAASLLLASVGTDLDEVAMEAGVDVVHLAGAVATTGMDARQYLYAVGELRQPRDAVDTLLDCLSWYESRHTPSARNPRSGAAGQWQFLPSTWAGTPQGKAGASPYDPLAARAAARWMVGQGRAREWAVLPLCR